MAHAAAHTKEKFGIDWKAALGAGLIAGAVFLVMEMMLVATVGAGSLWGPPRMMAAIVMGQEVLPPPATFEAGIVLTAMVVHFVLSLVLAFILAYIIRPMTIIMATVSGGIFGLGVYILNFYLIAPVIFPWFVNAQNWITIVSHIVFGLVLGWTYKAIARKRTVHT